MQPSIVFYVPFSHRILPCQLVILASHGVLILSVSDILIVISFDRPFRFSADGFGNDGGFRLVERENDGFITKVHLTLPACR